MYLLNVISDSLVLEEFTEDQTPPYAILSHTWVRGQEVSFQEIKLPTKAVKLKSGYAKIQSTAAQAQRDGLEYVWIDTCCINKSSSAELQEAINSMYRWYSKSQICYVHLSDVIIPPGASLEDSSFPEFKRKYLLSVLGDTLWMSRGWCLQELIAPTSIFFFAKDWTYLSSRLGILSSLAELTNIDSAILLHAAPLSSVSVAKRMSWAAHRKTSRVEDQAYCLLGIFEVSIPLLYGEGSRSFIRLQEEILRTSTDQSILAWSDTSDEARRTLLAPSPASFASCKNIVCWGRPAGSYSMNNRGLSITLPLLEIPKHGKVDSDHEEEYLGILNCRFSDDLSGTLALRLSRDETSGIFNISARDNEGAIGTQTAESILYTRLAFVHAHRIATAPPTSLEIARKRDESKAAIKLWLKIAHDMGYGQTCPFTVSNHFPSPWWKKGIMYPSGDEDHVYGGVTLHSERADKLVTLVFGYDRITSQSIGITKPSRLAAFIKAWDHNDKEADTHNNKFRCTHGQGSCRYYLQGECPVTPQKTKFDTIPDFETIYAIIGWEKIMDETVLVIDVSVSSRFELESIEHAVELAGNPIEPMQPARRGNYLTTALENFREIGPVDDKLYEDGDISPQSDNDVPTNNSTSSLVSPFDRFDLAEQPVNELDSSRLAGPFDPDAEGLAADEDTGSVRSNQTPNLISSWYTIK